MKTNKILMGSLAAGLMAFASDTTQAGVVIENTLYTPVNLKMTVSYVQTNVKGNVIKTAKITSKDILNNIWEFPKGTQLAVTLNGTVYAINKGEVLENLSAYGYFSFGANNLLSVEKADGKDGYKYSDAGTAFVGFYSDYEAGTDSDYWFQVNGTYNAQFSYSGVNSKGYYNDSVKIDCKNASGIGYDVDVSDSTLPVSGTVSGNGSGKLQAP